MNLITNAELAAYAPDLDLSNYDAATISGMIARASARVLGICNVDGFFKAQVTAETDRVNINSNGDLLISFRRPIVQRADVQAIRLRTVDMNQSLTLLSGSDYIFFIPNPGTYMVYPSNFLISHGRGLLSLRSANLYYEVDYIGGYATAIEDIPSDLKEAVTLLVRDSQHNNSGVTSFRQGSYGETRKDEAKSSLMQRAENILWSGGFVRMVV